jgi:hypothetical protein
MAGLDRRVWRSRTVPWTQHWQIIWRVVKNQDRLGQPFLYESRVLGIDFVANKARQMAYNPALSMEGLRQP